MANDSRLYVPKGIKAARSIAVKVQAAVLKAYRIGADVATAVDIQMRQWHPLLVDAMTVAHLYGMRRAHIDAPISIIATVSTYSESVDFLRRRMKLTRAEIFAIQDAYGYEALKTLALTGELAKRKIQRALLDIRREGVHVREGTKRLERAFAQAGLSPRNSFTLEAVFRTQTQLAYSSGNQKFLGDPDIQEILWGFKYVTVGDERVRDNHRPLEGMTAAKEHSVWQTLTPPNGWACRCQVIPVYEKRQEVLPTSLAIARGADPGFAFNPGNVF